MRIYEMTVPSSQKYVFQILVMLGLNSLQTCLAAVTNSIQFQRLTIVPLWGSFAAEQVLAAHPPRAV